MSGIFISYRRTDTPDAVGRIYDRLASEFGKERVFKDVDSIPLGQDFRGHLNGIVSDCGVMLVVIGPRWTDARNMAGQRRLEDPDDFVRIELEAALSRSIPVVPVLVGHALIPGASELPESLASLAFRQSIEVRPDPDFHNDATRLVSSLRSIIDPNGARAATISGISTQPIRPLRWMIAFAIATLVAIALAIPALLHLRETPAAETRTEIGVPAQPVSGPALALSPDGRQIAFAEGSAGVSRLWLRALASTVAQPLPGTEGATLPFWSPDGRSIGFFAGGALKRIDVAGGTVLTLAPVVLGTGGSWSAEGVIVFSGGPGQSLSRIAATGGAVTQVTHLGQDSVGHVLPLFLPDGRRFLYISDGGRSPGTYLGSLDGANPVLLTTAIGNMTFLPTGWLLIWDISQRALIARRLDTDTTSLVGNQVTLAVGASGAVSTSASGLLAYWRTALEKGKHQLQWRSRSGAELGTIGEPNETYRSPRVSPDGRRVIVVREDAGKDSIWLLEGARSSRVTFDANSDFPMWSADGAQILYSSSRFDTSGIYQKPADGGEQERLVLKYDGVIAPSSWSADGRYLTYVQISPNTGFDIGVLPLTGDRKPWMFLNTPAVEGAAEFSPDGKWVAYESNQLTRQEVYIRPFVPPGAASTTQPAQSGQWQVSTAGGSYPKWSANGKELFFLNPAGEMMAAQITVTGSTLTPGTPAKLFQTRVLGGGGEDTGGPQYDVARDGRFLINEALDAATSEPFPIILVQNWNPEAKQ